MTYTVLRRAVNKRKLSKQALIFVRTVWSDRKCILKVSPERNDGQLTFLQSSF